MLAQDALLRRSKTAQITEMTDLEKTSMPSSQTQGTEEKTAAPMGPVMGFPPQTWKAYTANLMNLFEKTQEVAKKGGLETPGVAESLRAARIKMMPD